MKIIKTKSATGVGYLHHLEHKNSSIFVAHTQSSEVGDRLHTELVADLNMTGNGKHSKVLVKALSWFSLYKHPLYESMIDSMTAKEMQDDSWEVTSC